MIWLVLARSVATESPFVDQRRLQPAMNLILLAQTSFSTYTKGEPPGPLTWLLICAVTIFMIAVMWKVFTKAGQPGWASLIPIYNTYIMIKMAGKPGWWLLLLLVPIVNLVIAIMIVLAIAERFGKGVGFGIGLVLLGIIFWPILAFGDAQFQAAPAPAA
jgi:Family of unknown function (DUF5684)